MSDTQLPSKHMDVVAAVMVRNNRVLIARRAPGEHLAGKWEFPGGKIEPGEQPEESLERELREEFGIAARAGAFLTGTVHEYPERTIRLLAYKTEHLSGDFKLTVHDTLRWVALESLLDQDLAPADLPIAKFLRRRDGP